MKRGTTKIENLDFKKDAISKKKVSGDTIGFITDATWTMIKAVDENLANSKDKNTSTSLKTDATQYLT